jgi:hypothetical protein
MPRRLTFVYSDRYRDSGSTVMRGFQLADIARSQLPSLSVSVRPLGHQLRHSSLFLTKGALKAATPHDLDALLRNGNRLLFDVVDEPPPSFTARYADTVVAASLTAYEEFSRTFPATRVALVNHHVDTRLRQPKAPVGAFRVGYFGERVNALLTASIEEQVDVVHIDTSRADTAWLGRIGEYSMHYAVRHTRELDHFKPFLKGFTAAHLGAPVLIQRNQEEAVRWLGPDYPYLIDDPVDESGVLAMLERARQDWGGRRWERAVDTMKGIRARTSPERIAQELAAAVL